LTAIDTAKAIKDSPTKTFVIPLTDINQTALAQRS
jgi:hypothetical protein